MSILQELVSLNEAKWSAEVHQNWTPPEGFFTKSSKAIGTGLMKASKDLAQASARLNFYMNRAGKNLSDADLDRLAGARKYMKEDLLESEDLDSDMAGSMAEELQELHEEMVRIMGKVRENVRSLPRHMRGQAEAYWIPHIMIALGGEHEWMTAGHESTMQKLIDELREAGEETGHDDGGNHEPDDESVDAMGRHHGRNY